MRYFDPTKGASWIVWGGVAALGATVVVALTVNWHQKPVEAEPSVSFVPTVQVVNPQTRTIAREVDQPGFVEAYEQTAIYSKVSGFIKSFCVDIGQPVKKGAPLADIFVPELDEDHQRKAAKTELDRKQVELAQQLVVVAETKIQTAAAQLDEARANVGKYQAEVVRWESELRRLTQMVKDRVVDRQVLDETQKQFDSARSALGAAQAAVAGREAAKRSSEADLGKAKIDVETARAQVKVSEADERRAAAMLAYTKVTAPYDSIVTVRNANTGDYVQAATGDKSATSAMPMFVVARSDLVRLFVDIPETYARYVREGTPALVRADALSGLQIHATVTRTSWSLHERTRTLRAEIDLEAKEYDGLRPGMYVYAKVLIERSHVYALPQRAVVVSGNQTYCYLLRSGKAYKTPILPGIRDGTWVEVVKMKIEDPWVKVTGKEEVLLCDLSEITDGQEVKVVRGTAS